MSLEIVRTPRRFLNIFSKYKLPSRNLSEYLIYLLNRSFPQAAYVRVVCHMLVLIFIRRKSRTTITFRSSTTLYLCMFRLERVAMLPPYRQASPKDPEDDREDRFKGKSSVILGTPSGHVDELCGRRAEEEMVRYAFCL